MHHLNPPVARLLLLLAGVAAVGPAVVRAAPETADRTADDAATRPAACHACGGTCGLVPVCHCRQETKTRPRTTYDIRCEPVCVPGGGGLFGGGACGCGTAGGTIRMKKTLVKRITDETVRGVKHEVRYVCRHCAGGACATCTGFVAHAPAEGSAGRWAGWLDLLGVR